MSGETVACKLRAGAVIIRTRDLQAEIVEDAS